MSENPDHCSATHEGMIYKGPPRDVRPLGDPSPKREPPRYFRLERTTFEQQELWGWYSQWPSVPELCSPLFTCSRTAASFPEWGVLARPVERAVDGDIHTPFVYREHVNRVGVAAISYDEVRKMAAVHPEGVVKSIVNVLNLCLKTTGYYLKVEDPRDGDKGTRVWRAEGLPRFVVKRHHYFAEREFQQRKHD